jgi:hypothetical protein
MDEDAQILARGLLADELVEALRPERRVGVFECALGRRYPGGIGGHQPLIVIKVTESAALPVTL